MAAFLYFFWIYKHEHYHINPEVIDNCTSQAKNTHNTYCMESLLEHGQVGHLYFLFFFLQSFIQLLNNRKRSRKEWTTLQRASASVGSDCLSEHELLPLTGSLSQQ